jgi:outer membrane protein assembly factor BamB
MVRQCIIFFLLFLITPGISFASDNKAPELNWSIENMHRDDTVVIGKRGELYARDIRGISLYSIDPTGEKIWQYRPFSADLSVPSVGPDGTIYTILVSNKERKSYLVALSPESGRELWRTVICPKAVWIYWLEYIVVASDGTIYVATNFNTVALDPEGKIIWSFDFPDRAYTSAPTLSRDEKVVYVYRRERGGVYAFNLDGSLRWHKSVKYYTDGASPVVGLNEDIYITDNTTKTIYAYSPAGEIRWKKTFPDKRTGNTYPVVGEDGSIYVQIGNPRNKGGELHSLDPKDGKIKWSFLIKDGTLASAVVISKKKLYYGAGNGYIYCFSPEGELLWEYDVLPKIKEEESRQGQFTSFPAISGGNIYIVTIGDKLLSIRVED